MPLSPRDRRALIVFGVITVVAAAAFFLFVNKGTKGTNATAPQAPSVSQPTPGSPTPEPSPTGKKKPKEVLVFSGRDPFCCNRPVAAVSGAGPTVSPAGNPSAGPGGGSSATFNGQTIVLVDIFSSDGQEQAQVEVDGTVYTVSPGDTFAGDFQLVAIDGTCADFLFQDQPFSLCETANK